MSADKHQLFLLGKHMSGKFLKNSTAIFFFWQEFWISYRLNDISSAGKYLNFHCQAKQMTEKFIKNSSRIHQEFQSEMQLTLPISISVYTYHQFHKDKQHLPFGVEMGHFEEHQRQLLAFFGVLNRVWLGGGFCGRAGLHELLSVVQQSIEKE